MRASLVVAALLLPLAATAAEMLTENPFAAAALVAPPRDGWPTNGGNLFNQRYSPLAEINAENVAELKGVWRTKLNGSGVGPPYSGEAQPIVHDGVLYIVTGANDVFALDLDSGDILWRYESHLQPGISTVCCGWTSRGVAIGGGRIYLGRLDNQLVALDIESGQAVWTVNAARWEDGYTITSAPLYYDGLVITGFAGAEYGTRGRVSAFRAADGAHVWTFHTVPAPGQRGHESWPQGSDIWKKGGGNVWQTPAADPALGLIYFATANPGPDFHGGLRAGDNLYTNSIVALDATSGAYRWHFQEVHHDIWDYDAANPVVLFDVELDGQARKAIAHAGKTGWVYLLDRVSGEPLLGIEERPVPQEPRQKTSPTQPYPLGDAFVPQSMRMPLLGYAMTNEGRIFTPFWDQPVVMKPGSFGAANWAPSSFDPVSNTLFICAIDMAGIFSGGVVDDRAAGLPFFGGAFNFPTRRSGVFAAMDLTTNRLRWRQRWEEMCYSGSATTAGGVVFTGLNDGRVIALDTSDGRLAWSFQTGAGVNAPPSVFMHNGRQHVAVYAAGALFANSPPGDFVWLFSRAGTLGEAPTPQRELGAIPVAHADPEAGREPYQRLCAQCHGADGRGGHGGGPQLLGQTDDARVVAMIADGGARMPAMRDALSHAEIRDIALFVTRILNSE